MKPPSLLLVEDNTVDVMTIKRAMKDINVTNQLIVTRNGEEALEFLKGPEGDRPCIILLDLQMPRMNGIEFLKIAKQDERLKSIPVVVLTSSRQEQDMVESYRLGVAGYMVKPVDYSQFVEIIRTIHLYWTISELPSN